MDEYLAPRRTGGRAVGRSGRQASASEKRRHLAELILPVVRGTLGRPERVILHYDDGDEVLASLAGERMPELVRRGMATPEHVLRAGRLPVWLELEAGEDTSSRAKRGTYQSADQIISSVRTQLTAARAEYEEYHRRHAGVGEPPLDDWAKVVLAPGLGVITAVTDKRSAVTANLCYRAVLEVIANAEAVDRFQFIPEREVFEFEHWPLERRKIEEQIAKERATKLLPRHVVVVIGGGSGIGRAAAHRFAEEGAHVVVADLDGDMSQSVAAGINGSHRERAEGPRGDPAAPLRAPRDCHGRCAPSQ
jgi:rhamnose utilization protein RhaD (predicted bifunctional aldolase and dehydrogenase)